MLNYGNPAALGALARGDIENFLVAATPGGIEAQEKAGQTTFVNNSTLPIDLNRSCTWEDLATLGIVKGEPVDDLFVKVELPTGWTKKPTEHSMWSDLCDEQGRVRARIFYKAAFYDRSAALTLVQCYTYGAQPVIKDDWNGPRWGVVCDQDVIIWHTNNQFERADYDAYDTAEKTARLWLESNYPAYKNPLAYW
jgi:hypothetical protein